MNENQRHAKNITDFIRRPVEPGGVFARGTYGGGTLNYSPPPVRATGLLAYEMERCSKRKRSEIEESE